MPVDFPIFETTVNTDLAAEGSLFVVAGGYSAILDRNGVPSFYIEEGAGDFKRHSNGQYSYSIRTGLNEFGRRQSVQVVLDESFNEIGRFETVGLNHTDGHDFLILPNGNYAFLAYNGEVRPDPENNNEERLFEDTLIQVVDPVTNEEVFSLE